MDSKFGFGWFNSTLIFAIFMYRMTKQIKQQKIDLKNHIFFMMIIGPFLKLNLITHYYLISKNTTK